MLLNFSLFALQWSKRIDTEFSVISETNKLTFFTGLDILLAIFWFFICLLVVNYVKNVSTNDNCSKYFVPVFIFKVFFGFIFGIYYLLVIGGGDSIAFFDCSVRLTNLLYYNPDFFWLELFQNQDTPNHVNYFTSETGFPPGWIRRENESYFSAKIFSFLNLVTFNCYFAGQVIIALLCTLSTMKLFIFFEENNIFPQKNNRAKFLFLFIPSLAFWCSGVSKDSIIMICLFFGIPIIFNLINKKSNNRILSIVYLFILSYFLIQIRSFMLIVLIFPVLFALNVKFVKFLFKNKFAQRSVRIFIFLMGLGFIFIYLGTSGQKILKEAEIIQTDFQQNKSYQGKKYSLGSTNFTPTGLVRAMPLSIVTAIFRPFPWEALSPGLILNGLESVILIYLLFQFLRKRPEKRFARIRDSELLTFSLYLVMIMAFMTGFTSIIFGLLVRLRAPLLPFIILLLTTEPNLEENTDLENDESSTAETKLSQIYS